MFSMTHIIIIAVVALVLFGGAFKFSDMMGDVAKGIKEFKKGMADDEPKASNDPVKTIDHQASVTTDTKPISDKVS